MVVLNNSQLKTWVLEVMDKVYNSCPTTVYNTLSISYLTGLRIEEANTPHRWQLMDDGSLMVVLSKRTPPRIITDNQVKNIVIPQITGLQRTFGEYSNDSIRRMIEHNAPYFIWRGDKALISHAWRYNYIRQLGEQGYTVDQIKAITLISSSQVVQGYLYSEIIKH